MFTISSPDFYSSIEAGVVSFAARNCAVVTDYLKLSSMTLSVCVWVLFSQMSVPSDASVGLICSWSGILLGSRQSHMVRSDSTDKDRFTGQRIPFITHFAPLFEKLVCHSWCFFLLSLWCCKRRRFSTDTFDSSWMYSGDLFRWLFLSEELLEFVRRQDLDRKMRWFHVIQ